MNKVIALMLSAGIALPALAERNIYGWEFLSASSSAYVGSIGVENVSSHSREFDVALQNPSLMTEESHNTASISYQNYLAGSAWFTGAYSRAIDDKNSWGAAVMFNSYGGMTETDIYGNEIGEFHPIDFMAEGLYSRLLADNFRVGIGFKLIYSAFKGLEEPYDDYSSFGFGFDVGANYFIKEKDLSLGFAVRNIGAQLKAYNDTRDRLPWNMQFGFTKGLEHAPFKFSVTYTDINRWDLSYTKYKEVEKGTIEEQDLDGIEEVKWGDMLMRHFVFSAEFVPKDLFSVVVSYNVRRGREYQLAEARSGAGFSFGLNLNIKKFYVGAAYSIFGKSANVFGATLGYKFDRPEYVETIETGEKFEEQD